MSNVETAGNAIGDRMLSTSKVRRDESWEDRINRAPRLAFAMLTLLYLIVVLSLSHLKLLWLDELITLHIAKLNSASAMWNALARGADPNPPVLYFLVHWSRAILGDHEWAYRLPAAIGYWIGLGSLFAYLRRLLPVTWALGGAVLSMTMAAFDYSYESRSYGLFYGLAMLASFAWTLATDAGGTRASRWFGLAMMTVALAAGISTNYFAVLAFFPVTAAEIVRTYMRARAERNGMRGIWRAIDLRIWIAMAIAAAPLIAYRGLIAHSIAEFAPYSWNRVSIWQAIDSYTEMVEIVLYPILALFLFAIGMWLVSRQMEMLCRTCRANAVPGWIEAVAGRPWQRLPIGWDAAAMVFCLMAYPFIGYAVASVRGGMLSPRFVIPVCFGFAIAAALVAYSIFGGMRRAGLVFLGFVLAWFVCRESYVGYWYEEQKQCFYKVIDRLPQAEAYQPSGAPIVIPDPLLVLTFSHYAPPSEAKRVVLPVDFPAVRAYRHDDSPEENLWAGRGYLYEMPIEPLADLVESTSDYLIIASDGNWMLQDFDAHHFPYQRLDIDTRAEAIGGFTPLAKGTPTFYMAQWTSDLPPTSFHSMMSNRRLWNCPRSNRRLRTSSD